MVSGFRGGSIQVEHQCPQCGGPVVLDETDRFLSCGFCRVRLYILSKEFLRYYFPPTKKAVEESLFVPYWRFRGMLFSVRPFEVKQKMLDTSFLSTDYKFLPASMGLRTQALKMKYASDNIKSDFIRPGFSLQGAISRVEKMTHFIDGHSHTGKVYHRAFIGDTVSMIYAPIYIDNHSIYDGILNRTITGLTAVRTEKLADIESTKNWKINFAPALCPDCGWDFSGERDSVVLFCRNCNTSWHAERGSFKKVDFGVMTCSERNDIYLPFWKMDADIEGVEINSYADLARMANLPRAIKAEWHEKKLFFWSPAFKVYPKIFARLARQVTVVQPEAGLKGSLPRSELFPVTLDIKEAFESVKITLANAVAAKRNIYPLLPDVNIVAKKATLIYLPFNMRGNDYVHPEYHVSIQRNSILNLRRAG